MTSPGAHQPSTPTSRDHSPAQLSHPPPPQHQHQHNHASSFTQAPQQQRQMEGPGQRSGPIPNVPLLVPPSRSSSLTLSPRHKGSGSGSGGGSSPSSGSASPSSSSPSSPTSSPSIPRASSASSSPSIASSSIVEHPYIQAPIAKSPSYEVPHLHSRPTSSSSHHHPQHHQHLHNAPSSFSSQHSPLPSPSHSPRGGPGGLGLLPSSGGASGTGSGIGGGIGSGIGLSRGLISLSGAAGAAGSASGSAAEAAARLVGLTAEGLARRQRANQSTKYAMALPLGVIVVIIVLHPLVALLLLGALASAIVLYNKAKEEEMAINAALFPSTPSLPPTPTIPPSSIHLASPAPAAAPSTSEAPQAPSKPPLPTSGSSNSLIRSPSAPTGLSALLNSEPLMEGPGQAPPMGKAQSPLTVSEPPISPPTSSRPSSVPSSPLMKPSLSFESPADESTSRKSFEYDDREESERSQEASNPDGPDTESVGQSVEVRLPREDLRQRAMLRKRQDSLLRERYGYCRSFMPLLLRTGQPIFMENNDEHNEVDLSPFSKRTQMRVIATANYLKQHYTSLFEYLFARQQRNQMIQEKLQQIKPGSDQAMTYRKGKAEKETQYLRLRRRRVGIRDFQVLSLLGRGGYGEVYLCRHRETGEVLALKRMKKSLFIDKNEVPRAKREREVMIKLKAGMENPWMVKLESAFQDATYLYLAMEYLPGGDLRNLLDNLGRLAEEHARMYIAEVMLAVESLHQLGYIHRDLKPNNFLIDTKGHLKLIDFGLSKDGAMKNLKNTRQNSMRFDMATMRKTRGPGWAYSLVGSPEYMAPEILEEKGYDEKADWWSVGILLYEMLYGFTPFMGETVADVFGNLSSWQDVLRFPDLSEIDEDEAPLSEAALDLMKKLICAPEERLGKFSLIQSHPFFRSLDWKKLRALTPPFVPKLKNEWDTSYFGDVKEVDTGADIGDILARELSAQETSKGEGESLSPKPTGMLDLSSPPFLDRRRSTYFASADQNVFAGFTYVAPPPGSEESPRNFFYVNEPHTKEPPKNGFAMDHLKGLKEKTKSKLKLGHRRSRSTDITPIPPLPPSPSSPLGTDHSHDGDKEKEHADKTSSETSHHKHHRRQGSNSSDRHTVIHSPANRSGHEG